MMRLNIRLGCLMTAFLVGCAPTNASKSSHYADFVDWDREKRVAEQIGGQLVFAEPVWLDTADGKRVFAIKSPVQGDGASGTVVLVHGTGAHANWSQVIQPLRIALSKAGWNTLSVQMPYIASDIPPGAVPDLFEHTNARIAAAVRYAKEDMTGPVYVVSHSRGGQQAAYYASHSGAPAIAGLVMVGTAAHYNQYPDPFDPAEVLKRVNVPTLDIYGSNDKHQIIATASQRERASAAQRYRRVEVPGAGHMWEGSEDKLAAHILGWLES